MNGNDIIIKIGSTPVACSKSCEIYVKTDTIEYCATRFNDADWRRILPGMRSWRVTVSYLVTSASNWYTNLGSVVTLNIADRSANKYSGSAILTTAKVTATRGNLVQGSWTFEGAGPLS